MTSSITQRVMTWRGGFVLLSVVVMLSVATSAIAGDRDGITGLRFKIEGEGGGGSAYVPAGPSAPSAGEPSTAKTGDKVSAPVLAPQQTSASIWILVTKYFLKFASIRV